MFRRFLDRFNDCLPEAYGGKPMPKEEITINSLETILKEATNYGLEKKQRHEVSIRYHASYEEARLYSDRFDPEYWKECGAFKAREYIRKHIDDAQTELYFK